MDAIPTMRFWGDTFVYGALYYLLIGVVTYTILPLYSDSLGGSVFSLQMGLWVFGPAILFGARILRYWKVSEKR